MFEPVPRGHDALLATEPCRAKAEGRCSHQILVLKLGLLKTLAPQRTSSSTRFAAGSQQPFQPQRSAGNFGHPFTLSPGEQEKALAVNDTLHPGRGKKKTGKAAL